MVQTRWPDAGDRDQAFEDATLWREENPWGSARPRGCVCGFQGDIVAGTRHRGEVVVGMKTS
jgi:hypothetical protein